MAKKKRVDIKKVPLESVTVGKIKENKHGLFFTIVIFVLFVAFIYFLPEMNIYYNKVLSILGISSTSNDNDSLNNDELTNDDSEDNDSDIVEDNKQITVSEEAKITIDELAFSNFVQANGVFTFNVLNNSTNDISLQEKKLFLHIYDDKNNLLSWYMLEGNVLTNSSLAVNLNVAEEIKFFNIIEVTEYPAVDIKENENGEATITCTKDEETIIYTFVNKKLIKVSYDLKFESNSEKYSYSTYLDLYNQYKNINGVKVNVISSSLNVNYTLTIDYSIYTGSLNDYYLFTKDESINKVNYIMKSLSYKCS